MCFMLYLGARLAPPLSIPYSERSEPGKIYTGVVKECDLPVLARFTLPHVVCVGSDQGCGCGFRHTAFEGFWPDEMYAPFSNSDLRATQPNHEGLAKFLRQHFANEAFVELYGYWADDLALPKIDRRELTLADILSPAFHFHQRGYCRVTLAGALDAPAKLAVRTNGTK